MLRSVFLAVGLLLCGCQGVPPLNFSVPNVRPSTTKLAAEVKSVSVELARAEEQESMLKAGDETGTPIWKSALEDALSRAAIFRDDAPRKVSISVKVLKVSVPGIGITFPTDTAARYQIIDRATGTVIYDRRIEAQGVAPSDFAFLGIARAREAVNRSVQNNIAAFLASLSGYQLPPPPLAPAA